MKKIIFLTLIFFTTILNVQAEEINEMTSVDNCEEWDSFQHMSLLVAIEEEFDLSLNDEEVLRMKDFTSIIDILENHK